MIHHSGDRRGPRKVFVNGNEIDGVIFADTVRGLVEFAPKPARVKKNSDTVYTRKLRGSVTVEPM